MKFGGLQKCSTIDFPGMLSCVLFTRGCDLDCFYCHNRELLSLGEVIEEGQILDFLKHRQGLLDGVVISGGEPTLQPELEPFLRKVHEMGYQIKLDTNGQHPETVMNLWKANLLDYVAVDCKAAKKQYLPVCKKEDGFTQVLKTITFLIKKKATYEVRTTLYPGMTIEELLEIFSTLPVVGRWRLNYFKMPLSYLPEDENRLHQTALTPNEIHAALPRLLAFQPNLLWEP